MDHRRESVDRGVVFAVDVGPVGGKQFGNVYTALEDCVLEGRWRDGRRPSVRVDSAAEQELRGVRWMGSQKRRLGREQPLPD